ALFARRGSGQVAQPGKALQLLGQRIRRANAGEIEIGEWNSNAPRYEPAREQGLPALAIADHMVPGHGNKLQRLPRALQPGKERSAGELANDILLGCRIRFTHPSPRSVRILSA